jgi:hypothetical protein
MKKLKGIEVVDTVTGEIVSGKVSGNSSYTKLFVSSGLLDILMGVSTNTLLALHIIRRLGFRSNEVRLFRCDKEEIAGLMGRSVRSIENGITYLVKIGFMKRSKTRGIYVLNPSVVYRGGERDRKKLEIEF